MTDESLRGEIAWLDGTLVTRGQLLVNYAFGQCTAYRLQLFLYLKVVRARRAEHDEPVPGRRRAHAGLSYTARPLPRL